LVAQFDGMMQLTLQQLTVAMMCADSEGPGNKEEAYLIFQRPVIQCTQFITEDTNRTQDGSVILTEPLSKSSHLWQTLCIIPALESHKEIVLQHPTSCPTITGASTASSFHLFLKCIM